MTNNVEVKEVSLAGQICEYVKLFVASCIVFLLVAVACVGIANKWCILDINPAGGFIVLLMALTLLAYCEALHYACVSVEKWDMNKYQDIFPRAYRCYLLVDTPEKVKRFLIGRQFFTIFVVFLIAQLTSFPGIPPDFAGMPPILVTILVQTGLPGIAITLTFGQLISQIYVEEFTLQFLNLYGCQLVIRMSLFVESTGVCNFSWLLYHLASKFFCKYLCGAGKNIPQSQADNDTATLEAPGSPTARIRGPDYVPVAYSDKPLSWWDYVKYTWSTCAILFSLFVILYGIGIRAYVLPVNVGGAYIIFFMVMTMLFYLEGMMIAIVATQYWDRETFSDSYRRAYILHEVINRPDNVKRFIIGRQFCTVLTNFLLAQITTFKLFPSAGYNKILFFILVQSGLVGVLVTLSFAQLLPELLAQEFPLRFMNMYGAPSIGYISLIFDAIGVGHCGWTIFYLTRYLCCAAYMKNGREDPAVKQNSGDGGVKSQRTSFSIDA